MSDINIALTQAFENGRKLGYAKGHRAGYDYAVNKLEDKIIQVVNSDQLF